MMCKCQKFAITAILVTISLALTLAADTVTTTDGSTLNGEITLIDKDIVHIKTTYAGTLKLDQKMVASIESDAPLNFRLKNGTTLSGTVTSKNKKVLSIHDEGGIQETSTDQIVASWTLDKIDPEIERNKRKWKNDFAIDLTGRTGNVERFNLNAKLDLRLKGPFDEIHFGFDYELGEQNKERTEDRTLTRASYERFNKNKLGWFARTILEQDPINGINIRSTTTYGASLRLINNEAQSLVFRGGLGYRYTEFENGDLDNESTFTIEPGLTHTYRYKDWFFLENNLYYSPALHDFDNYNATHDSSIRLPMGNSESFWIRIGIRHEYESQTSADENLDTNYYSQLVYSWK